MQPIGWVSFLTLLLTPVHSLYFYLKEGDEKCFIKELAISTLFTGHYRCELTVPAESHPPGMRVEVKDPFGRLVLSREYSREGRFSFTSHLPGEHIVCMRSRNSKEPHAVKVFIAFQSGEHAINYTNVAKKEKLTEMQTLYRKLNDQAKEVVKELDYQRYREEMFRTSTETISRRVLMWAVGQTVILILLGIWQVQNLRLFFENKKLV